MSVPIGSIYRLPFRHPPKPKFFTVVSVDPLLSVFLISSQVRPFIAKKPDLRATQIWISQQDYPEILHHDSVIDCYETIAPPVTLENLEYFLDSEDASYKGRLNHADLRRLLSAVQNSRILPRKRIKVIDTQITAALKSYI